MYQKNFVQDKWVILDLKMAHPHNSGGTFFKFCRMKGANWYMKISLVRKKFIWGNLIFLAFRPFFTVWLGMVKLSRPLLIGSLNSQDIIRILKQWRYDFSGKHLCDRYCMNIMWCLCGGQNSCFCKASLTICYLSLFECKGPWMLKTIINCYMWNRKLQN